jgi:hypothetical protein
VTDARETYLGDGLYASYDGFAMTLRAPRPNRDHITVLEPTVMAEFLRFAERVGMIKPRRPTGDAISVQIGAEP